MKRIIYIASIIIIFLMASLAITYYKDVFLQKTPGCLSVGRAADNASLGPEGHFGECCAGLKPMAKKNDISSGISGNAAYCTRYFIK